MTIIKHELNTVKILCAKNSFSQCLQKTDMGILVSKLTAHVLPNDLMGCVGYVGCGLKLIIYFYSLGG